MYRTDKFKEQAGTLSGQFLLIVPLFSGNTINVDKGDFFSQTTDQFTI